MANAYPKTELTIILKISTIYKTVELSAIKTEAIVTPTIINTKVLRIVA